MGTVNLEQGMRTAFRSSARWVPWLYRWRNRQTLLVQRFRGGVHDPDFNFLRGLDVGEPLVLDVGANVGQTLLTVKTVLPLARVVSFEPSTLNLPSLARLAARYPGTATVAPFGASDAYGTLVLTTPIFRSIPFTQYATVEPFDADAVAASMTLAGFGAVRASEIRIYEERCAVVPLDSLFESCDVLKIDTEGHEDAVLRGAASLLESLPIVIVERPSAGVTDALQGRGYKASHGALNAVFVHPHRRRGVSLTSCSGRPQ